MSKEKIVLAYSGGLDTSVSIKWLQEKYGYDVIALGIDVGEGKDLEAIRQKALNVGAIKAVMIDGKELLANEYILPTLKANTLYEGKYPLSSALSRPLISKLLVQIAEEEGAVAVAHGCTGKGNDQVRFEVSIQALNPTLKVVAPVREWGMTRDEEIEYAEKHGIPIPIDLDNPFSIDANIWGRACEAGVLENPWNEAPEEAFAWTNPIEKTPDEVEYLEISFDKGIPIAINDQEMGIVEVIETLNELAGKHGIGRIDHIENRLVGIKSREVYENPAALLLINAHKELEFLTLPREVTQFKTTVEQQLAKMIYEGLWYSPLKPAIDAFIEETQRTVTGKVRIKLFKGTHVVVGRQSPFSLYNEELATYSKGDAFDHNAAVGFIKLWGLPTKVYSEIQSKTNKEQNLLSTK
ncbi:MULTISPECIES: argininosuccinate synthase [Heyndrickxia]|jgi:argininosuccinate synthase|uniref:argininosuccinate synthase n=1 Tax=Heyndrickxia TaxID=2837504 RepID=UPI00242ACEB1|nr:argininosuccinate synthase [Heyndrickxia oleronia]MCI1591029.1 argininosuccinate synthase [Heyndrickxia oleronia]MCI1613088.1 argininosuccinate synthase [Heyndrickxia oleronia]MCI1761022.1 argininosuccinate synthase [Heyndrickxia oleronia]